MTPVPLAHLLEGILAQPLHPSVEFLVLCRMAVVLGKGWGVMVKISNLMNV